MKQKIGLAIAGIITIVSLYWVFKDIKLSDLVAAISSMQWIWLVPTLALFYLSMYLRCVRWGYLFRPHYQLNGRQLVRPIFIGFAINGILPGRVGEFARAYYCAKKLDTGFPPAFASIVTERIFDAVTLLALLGGALLLLPPIDPDLKIDFGGYVIEGSLLNPLLTNLMVACGVLIVGVGLFMIPAFQKMLAGLPYALKNLPEKRQDQLSKFVTDTAKGFESVRDPVALFWIVLYSIGVWALVALSAWTLTFGFDGLEMNLLQASALISLIAVFILIPAAPGYWGLYEAGAIFTLAVLGIIQQGPTATAYAIVLHLTQYVPILIVGLPFAFASQIGFGKPDEASLSEGDSA